VNDIRLADPSINERVELKIISPSRFHIHKQTEKNNSDFDELVNSIREHGLIHPIYIRPVDRDFEIISGHRRFQACKALRWKYIPSKIAELSDKDAYEVQLTENLQRRSMDPIEEAESFRRYVFEYGWGGMAELAKRIGKSEEYVSHRMQLLRLPQDIKAKVSERALNVSQAIEISQIPPAALRDAADTILNRNLTVKQIRMFKTALKDAYENEEPQFETLKDSIFVEKTALTLKVALSRMDNIINEVYDAAEPRQRSDLVSFLMETRIKIHAMIDESISFRMNLLQKKDK
jgi:ParB family transcriptional regulator, chromosome partitioning protein